MVRLPLVFSCKPEIHQLDILVLVEEDILELQVAMDAVLEMDIGDCTDQLGKDLLDLGDR